VNRFTLRLPRESEAVDSKEYPLSMSGRLISDPLTRGIDSMSVTLAFACHHNDVSRPRATRISRINKRQ
jgi:hypothetical protein